MAVEIAVGFSWLESTLAGDSVLRGLVPGGVWQTFALPGTTPPYILLKYQSGIDYPVFGGGRAYADLRFHAIVTGPFASIQTIWDAATRMDVLLTVETQTAVTGGVILASFREQSISTDEWVDGAKWNVTGGEYRIMAKGS